MLQAHPAAGSAELSCSLWATFATATAFRGTLTDSAPYSQDARAER